MQDMKNNKQFSRYSEAMLLTYLFELLSLV